VQPWVWSALGAFASGAFLFLFTRGLKRADEKRDRLERKIDANTEMTARNTYATEDLARHVNTQNGRIGKLEDRLYRRRNDDTESW
jgi:hypothetical protein